MFIHVGPREGYIWIPEGQGGKYHATGEKRAQIKLKSLQTRQRNKAQKVAVQQGKDRKIKELEGDVEDLIEELVIQEEELVALKKSLQAVIQANQVLTQAIMSMKDMV